MLIDLQQDWAARLVADGFARFDRISTRAQLLTLGTSLGRVVAHRDSDDDGVTTLQDRGGIAKMIGYEGFGVGALSPHTDRSGWRNHPHFCSSSAGEKATPAVSAS